MISIESKHSVGRLKKRSEFLAVRNGFKLRGKLFLLEVLQRSTDDKAPPRIGFTVTKRQGNAVIRNRIRRRLKEAVRIKAHKYMRNGHDYVLVGHKDLLEVPFEDIIYSLKERFNNAANSDRTRRPKR